jgi:hypothetical protein
MPNEVGYQHRLSPHSSTVSNLSGVAARLTIALPAQTSLRVTTTRGRYSYLEYAIQPKCTTFLFPHSVLPMSINVPELRLLELVLSVVLDDVNASLLIE